MFLHRAKENLFNEKDRWFSFVPVLVGIGIGIYFTLSFEPSIWISLGIIEALILLAVIFRFRPPVLFILMIFAFIMFGFTLVQLKAFRLSKDYMPLTEDKKVYVYSRVVDFDYNFHGFKRLILDDVRDYKRNEIKGLIKVGPIYGKDDIEMGDCVRLMTLLRPSLQPVMVGGFQFSRRDFFTGIAASGTIKSRIKKFECERKTPVKDKFFAYIQSVRSNIVQRIVNVLPKEEASVTAALIAGERGKIPNKLYDNYRDSGLAHFLSISGLHMSMITGLMFFLVRLILAFIPKISLKYDSKKIAAYFAMAISAIYLLISGADVPSQRAFIMTFIVLLGVLFARTAISMKTISWAALVILIIAPEALIGASFQMSFAAVICMIAFYERYAGELKRYLGGKEWYRIIIAYVVGILVTDLVASFATLPFAIYHFNRVAVYTTLGNFLAGPIIGLIIMPFILLSLLLMPFGLETFALKITGWGVGVVNDITRYVSGLNGAGLQVLSMPTWGFVCVVLGGLWLCIWKTSWRKWGLIGIVIGFLSIFITSAPDVIVGRKTFAVKNEKGDLVVMPGRGSSFERKLWLEKNAMPWLPKNEYALLSKIFKGEKVDKNFIDLECDELKCVYKGLTLNKKDLGKPRSIWLPDRVITVKEYVGDRYWNR